MKEKVVKDRVKKLLKEHDCYYFMPVQSGYGSPSLDFLCCYEGKFFAVETKAPGKRLTARQENTKHVMEAHGATVFVVGEYYYEELNDFSGMEQLEAWLLLKP